MPTHCRRCFFQMKWAKLAYACTRRTRFPAFARPSASTRPESTRERKPVQLLQRLPETGYVLIRPRIPLWVCRTRRQGRRILHGLEALPAAKTACHPVVLMMKGFTAATKRTAPGSATQGRAGRTDEAAQGSADGTGGSTRQSGRNGRQHKAKRTERAAAQGKADGTGGAASPRQIPATTGPTAGLWWRMATHRIAQDDLAPGSGRIGHSGWIVQSAGIPANPARARQTIETQGKW